MTLSKRLHNNMLEGGVQNRHKKVNVYCSYSWSVDSRWEGKMQHINQNANTNFKMNAGNPTLSISARSRMMAVKENVLKDIPKNEDYKKNANSWRIASVHLVMLMVSLAIKILKKGLKIWRKHLFQPTKAESEEVWERIKQS